MSFYGNSRAIEVNLRIKTYLESQSFLYEIVTSTLLDSAKEARYVVHGRLGAMYTYLHHIAKCG